MWRCGGLERCAGGATGRPAPVTGASHGVPGRREARRGTSSEPGDFVRYGGGRTTPVPPRDRPDPLDGPRRQVDAPGSRSHPYGRSRMGGQCHRSTSGRRGSCGHGSRGSGRGGRSASTSRTTTPCRAPRWAWSRGRT
ncbi:hypothetical protein SSAG_03016 [Streptomyces sp. Mg1]|nr:hypothetical protein SSAG_03016 [Streptomyces sp. Mg1]